MSELVEESAFVINAALLQRFTAEKGLLDWKKLALTGLLLAANLKITVDKTTKRNRDLCLGSQPFLYIQRAISAFDDSEICQSS